MPNCAKMTRCECQETPFATVVRYAREHREWDFNRLCDRVGCGQVCTGCHCDLKQVLLAARERERRQRSRPTEIKALEQVFNPSPSM